MPTETQTIEQLSAARADKARLAAAFEKFCKTDVADVLKSRWIAWHEIAPAAVRAGFTIPPVLVADNERMDRATRQFAELVAGLDKQTFLLVQTQVMDKEGTINTLAIIHREAARKAGLLGAFVFLPVLWTGVKIVAGIAAFLAAIKAGQITVTLIDAWNAPQKLAEEAKLLHEKNIAAAQAMIDNPQLDPGIKAAYLQLLAKTSDKITNTTGPGFLQSVLGASTFGLGGLAIGLIIALIRGRKR